MKNIKTIFISLVFLFTFINSGSKGHSLVKPEISKSSSEVEELNKSLESVIEEHRTLKLKNDSLTSIKLNIKTQ